jgi:hypothetical protein
MRMAASVGPYGKIPSPTGPPTSKARGHHESAKADTKNARSACLLIHRLSPLTGDTRTRSSGMPPTRVIVPLR